MRIAMLSTPFLSVPPADYGGTELVVSELTEGLVARGHDVTLFATGDSRTAAELRFLYETPRWPPDSLTDLNHVSWAMQAVLEGGFDVVHAHSAAALALSRFLPGVPVVYTIHHERDEALSSYYHYFPATHFVAISADQKARETALRRCEVIHHGLDATRYEWRPSAVGDFVCFIGRFARVKGPHDAIDAAARAGVPIRVAGDIHDVDREFANAEVVPRLASPHVQYLGCIGMAEKVPLLRDARALLFPIAWNEPFGLAMIEAMLCGCPVVAFPRGSVPELVEPGLTGFIVESVDEMARLIAPGGVLDSFDRRACRERAVERFGRDRMVTEHERLYEQAAAAVRYAAEENALVPSAGAPVGAAGTPPIDLCA